MRVLLATLLAVVPVWAFALEPGDQFPTSVQLSDEHGAKLNISKFQTPFILIDFWASWCGACAKAFPALNSLADSEKSTLSVVGVNVDGEKQDALDFLKEHRHSFPVIFDSRGELPDACAVDSMPTSILIKRSGEVVKVFKGFSDGDAALIRDLVKQVEIKAT